MSVLSGTTSSDHTDELEGLASGYALGILDASERAQFATHLESCQRCALLVGDYGVVVGLLPEALEPVRASGDLKLRIQSLIREPEPMTEAIAAPVVQIDRARRSRQRWLSPWSGALAATLFLLLGAGGWIADLRAELAGARSVVSTRNEVLNALSAGGRHWEVKGTEAAPDARGLLVEAPRSGRPMFVSSNLPALPPDQQYQVWMIAGAAPVGVGLLDGAGPDGVFIRLERTLGTTEVVALTIEPRGGSPGPTGPIVLAAKLS
ncbi:MAG: anti-sigma factor [Chloroflexota bacterium]